MCFALSLIGAAASLANDLDVTGWLECRNQCGARAVVTVLESFGIEPNLAELRGLLPANGQAKSLLELKEALAAAGVPSHGRRFRRGATPPPDGVMILLVRQASDGQAHFITYLGSSEEDALIADGFRVERVALNTLWERWDGTALVCGWSPGRWRALAWIVPLAVAGLVAIAMGRRARTGRDRRIPGVRNGVLALTVGILACAGCARSPSADDGNSLAGTASTVGAVGVEPAREQTVRLAANSTMQAEVRFVLVNKSNRPIQIINVDSSCGCTVPAIHQKSLEPGKPVELLATVHGDRQLDRESRITVTTDNASEPTIGLVVHIKAPEELPGLFLTWQQPIQLMGLEPDAREAMTPLITVEESGQPDWLAGVRLAGTNGTIDGTIVRETKYDLAPAKRRGYEVRIPLDGKPGRVDGELLFLDRNGGIVAKHPCSYEIRPWLEVLPRSLMGSFAEGSAEPMERVIILDPARLKQPDFQVTVAPPTVDWLKHDIKVENGLTRVSVTANVSKLTPGTHESSIAIQTNTPKEPAISVPIRVHIRKGGST